MKFQIPNTQSVAIVGSSAKLLESEHGKSIDFFEEVIRLNRAPTRNYEQFVGSKTTIRVVNSHIFTCEDWGNHRWSNEGQPQYFVRDLRDHTLVYVGNTSERHYREGVDHIHPSMTIQMLPKTGQTVGMITIQAVVNMGIRPTIFGFLPVSDGRLTHYWEDRDNKSSHNYSSENAILEKLHKEGKVILIP